MSVVVYMVLSPLRARAELPLLSWGKLARCSLSLMLSIRLRFCRASVFLNFYRRVQLAFRKAFACAVCNERARA